MTTDHTTDEPRTVISDHDQRRILAAMNQMPYSATDRVPTPWRSMGAPLDADAIVAYLDGLASVLTEVAEQSTTERRHLFALEADVQAFRRLLGTSPAEVTP